MVSEEVIKKQSWLHFSDDILNLSVIKTIFRRWNGTFSKYVTFIFML